MEPMTMAAIANTLASVGSSILGKKSQSRAQRREAKRSDQFYEQRQSLVNELLNSLGGQGGRFSSLFNADEEAFQKSFVDPAKSIFKNQLAPQIQQGSIAGGMQRSSSLDDQLLRAGVDLDQMLNQNYAAFQGEGKNRASNMLSNILGLSAPSINTAPQTSGSILGEGLSGLFKSDAAKSGMNNIFSSLFSGSNNGELDQSQKDLLNNPVLGALDASNRQREGFIPSNMG